MRTACILQKIVKFWIHWFAFCRGFCYTIYRVKFR